jgi:hypothetical protein
MFINFQKEQSRHSLNPFHSLLYTVPFFSDSRGRQRWHQRSHKLHAKLFPTGTTLMYAIGAVVGLVGGCKGISEVERTKSGYQQGGSAWFGSCIFLVIVATVLQSFFGI